MRVLTLTKDVFQQKLYELSCKINFSPDMVVQVLNSGVYLGDELKKIQKFKDVCYVKVKPKRDRGFIKQSFLFDLIVKILPYKFLDKLRVYESDQVKNSIDKIDLNELSKITIDLNHLAKQKKQNILIIDDAVDSGRTVFLIQNNLKKQYPNAVIKTAVLSWTLGNSIIKPDYYIYKDILVRFPWSKDHKEKNFGHKNFSD